MQVKVVNIRHNNMALSYQLTEDFNILKKLYGNSITTKAFKAIAELPNWNMYIKDLIPNAELRYKLKALNNKYWYMSSNKEFLRNWCKAFVLTQSERDDLFKKGII